MQVQVVCQICQSSNCRFHSDLLVRLDLLGQRGLQALQVTLHQVAAWVMMIVMAEVEMANRALQVRLARMGHQDCQVYEVRLAHLAYAVAMLAQVVLQVLQALLGLQDRAAHTKEKALSQLVRQVHLVHQGGPEEEVEDTIHRCRLQAPLHLRLAVRAAAAAAAAAMVEKVSQALQAGQVRQAMRASAV